MSEDQAKKDKAAIVLFSGELDKALAAFNIATTAAAMGMDVTIFFTFWGLNVIRKEKGSPPPAGWMERMLGLLNRGGANRLPLSKFHMLGLGTWMMKKLMRQRRMPSLPEMIRLAKQLGVRFVACTTSLGVMGLSEDSLIPEVDAVAGAATFVGEAREAKMSLFI